MRTIEEITQLAVAAHSGQKDMIGNPAILHVLAVGLMGETELEQKAGFLHDVVEDTPLTIEDLRTDGVEEEVLAAMDLLTHRDGISYEKYVKNIVASGNQIAIHAKLNDLRHNLLRARHSLGILSPTGSTQALYEEILQIAIKHDWAEQYIRRSRQNF